MANTHASRSDRSFAREPLPKRFCNLDRLLHALEVRGLDGIVATLPNNVFYLSGFNGIAHKSDEPRVYAVMLSRHAPEHPILVIADYYLATFLTQPTWIEDIRPFRAVMMPLDLPREADDIDRFIPHGGLRPGLDREVRAGATRFDMGSALRGALTELKLDRGRVAFDDMGFGLRLGIEGIDGRRRLRSADVRARGQEPTPSSTCSSARRGSTRRPSATPWHPGTRAPPGATSTSPTRARWPSSAASCAIPAAWCGAIRAGTDATIMLRHGLRGRRGRGRHARHVRLPRHASTSTAGTAARPGWSTASRRATRSAAPRRPRAVAETLLDAMRPGACDQRSCRRARASAYRQAGVPDPDTAVIFFHGLGLSHMELELMTADGKPNGDWVLEEGMVAPDPPALSRRRARPLLVRGGRGDHARTAGGRCSRGGSGRYDHQRQGLHRRGLRASDAQGARTSRSRSCTPRSPRARSRTPG